MAQPQPKIQPEGVVVVFGQTALNCICPEWAAFSGPLLGALETDHTQKFPKPPGPKTISCYYVEGQQTPNNLSLCWQFPISIERGTQEIKVHPSGQKVDKVRRL